jgi:hypothetical protein
MVVAAGLILAACGLLVFAWEFSFTWALSGGTYPGPFAVSVVPFVVGAVVCVALGRRLAAPDRG